jgi:hypothetical protein
MAPHARRTIPPVLEDPRTRGLSLEQERTLLLLPLALDDYGRCLDDAGTLNGILWGSRWEEHPPPALDADLDALQRAGFVARYEIDGVRYLQMLDWREQQVVSRPRPSRYPAPPGGSESKGFSADAAWATVESLVNVMSGAAEKLHDPAVQAKGVRLLTDLADQIDPRLGGKVRTHTRTWVGDPGAWPNPHQAEEGMSDPVHPWSKRATPPTTPEHLDDMHARPFIKPDEEPGEPRS